MQANVICCRPVASWFQEDQGRAYIDKEETEPGKTMFHMIVNFIFSFYQVGYF